MKRSRRAHKSAQSKLFLLTSTDRKLFERLRSELTAGVEKLGDYAPELDGALIDQAARCIVYAHKAEKWLDEAKSASDFASVSDALTKHRRGLIYALDGLAANRKQRLATKTTQEVRGELEKIIDRVMGLAEDENQ